MMGRSYRVVKRMESREDSLCVPVRKDNQSLCLKFRKNTEYRLLKAEKHCILELFGLREHFSYALTLNERPDF